MNFYEKMTRAAENKKRAKSEEILTTYLDGLDALTDGRGFDARHQSAYETIINALNSHEDLIEKLKLLIFELKGLPAHDPETIIKANELLQSIEKGA